MNRQQIEKIIDKDLGGIKSIEKLYIDRKNQDSIDVVVVLSNLNDGKVTAKILDLETKINKNYKTTSDFKLYPSGALAL